MLAALGGDARSDPSVLVGDPTAAAEPGVCGATGAEPTKGCVETAALCCEATDTRCTGTAAVSCRATDTGCAGLRGNCCSLLRGHRHGLCGDC